MKGKNENRLTRTREGGRFLHTACMRNLTSIPDSRTRTRHRKSFFRSDSCRCHPTDGEQDEPHLAASELPTKKLQHGHAQLQFDMKFIQSFRLLLLQRDFRTSAVASVVPIERSPHGATSLQKFDCIFVETQHKPSYSGAFEHNLVANLVVDVVHRIHMVNIDTLPVQHNDSVATSEFRRSNPSHDPRIFLGQTQVCFHDTNVFDFPNGLFEKTVETLLRNL